LLILAVALAVIVTGGLAWAYTPDKSRAELQALYTSDADTYPEAAGITLHVRDEGPRDAQVIVLLHGFGDSLLTWDGWASRLKSSYRVIRYDLPGFGLTGPDPTGDYSDARGAQVLEALLNLLGVTKATLVGNSMGGKLAWQFAAAHPDHVAALVLVSPDGFASEGFEYDKPASVPAMLRLLPYTLPTMMVRMSLAPAFGDKNAMTDAMVTRYRDMLLAPGVREAMLDRLGQTIVRDPEARLRAIAAPTLLIWGEKDRMIPFPNSADYLRDIKGAVLAPLPGLGHVPQVEAPETSLAPLLNFLQSNGIGATTPKP
jgi:pimeloyl-ACP methyl ester carboxylesterase